MHIHTRNVNTAFRELVTLFRDGELYDGPSMTKGDRIHNQPEHRVSVIKKPSRNGNVMMIDEPVTITYSHPLERVLFNQTRDCNPFFHLYEALWMLAGRNDVAPLAYYASKMKDFSDDGKTFNGAYGHRWRKYLQHYVADNNHVDQLNILVNHLKADPNSRRAVLQMWNVEDDLLKIGPWLVRDEQDSDPQAVVEQSFSKDVCCNLSVMFSLRVAEKIKTIGYQGPWPEHPINYRLDMTVTNRSNDMIWGTFGADFVDFSILHEYVAARLGVQVGKYHHFTNNLHVYDWNWKPEEWLAWESGPDFNSYFPGKMWKSFPLIKDPAVFEKELPRFVEAYSGENPGRGTWTDWSEPFFSHVAVPMMDVFYCYKRRNDPQATGAMGLALGLCENIRADDWRIVCTNWITKRMK